MKINFLLIVMLLVSVNLSGKTLLEVKRTISLDAVPTMETTQQCKEYIESIRTLEGSEKSKKELLLQLVPECIRCIKKHICNTVSRLEYTINNTHNKINYGWLVSNSIRKKLQNKLTYFSEVKKTYLCTLGKMEYQQYEPHENEYSWVEKLLGTATALSGSGKQVVTITDFDQALNSITEVCEIIDENETQWHSFSIFSQVKKVTYLIGHNKLAAVACALGSYVMVQARSSKWHKKDFLHMKKDYQDLATDIETRFGIPDLKEGEINRAADVLDTGFIKQRMLPALTRGVRAKAHPRGADRYYDAAMNRMPPCRFSMGAGVAFVLDRIVDRFLPSEGFSLIPSFLEPAVGYTAVAGMLPGVNHAAQAADGALAGVQAVEYMPDIGLQLLRIYEMKAKLLAQKIGIGFGGFITLFALYKILSREKRELRRDAIVMRLHEIMSILILYQEKLEKMSNEHFGELIYQTNALKNNITKIPEKYRLLFERDIHRLGSLTVAIKEKQKIVDYMYQTYNHIASGL